MLAASQGTVSLFEKLEEEAVQCALLEDQSGKFLPRDVVEGLITKDIIADSLSFPAWLYSRLSDTLPSTAYSQARNVFAVLGLIGQEWAIRDLIYKDGITDDDLPLDRRPGNKSASSILISRKNGKTFSSFQTWTPAIVGAFLEKQWYVLAPVLDTTGTDLKLDPRCPLPIQRSELKVQNHGVFVYQAWLHPAHLLSLGSLMASESPSVAIKETRQRDVFEREKENLKRIEGLEHKHLIKLLASCEKGSFRCFIFPWAEGGDLRELWKREDKTPRTQELILWSLEQVFGLIDAVRALHHGNIRHGDIKPQNILHFTKADSHGHAGFGTLVLADVGVSKYHESATNLRNAGTDTAEVTILYEAPEAEYDRKNNNPRSRRYDMWSTGCMLVEFVVWLLYGFEAVETFRSRRISSKGDPTTAPGNFFRQNSKGEVKMHSKVLRAFKHLREDPRCQEHTALADLLNLIDDCLLRIDPEERATADTLHEKLAQIVLKARCDSSYLYSHAPTGATMPETPKFFVRSARPVGKGTASKHRKYSDSSQSSSQSSESWAPHTGGSLDSLESLDSPPLTGGT